VEVPQSMGAGRIAWEDMNRQVVGSGIACFSVGRWFVVFTFLGARGGHGHVIYWLDNYYECR
jgi:hypothetical protein